MISEATCADELARAKNEKFFPVLLIINSELTNIHKSLKLTNKNKYAHIFARAKN